ncbi:MAG: helix-turn-helix domain-containing protein [Bacteroidales bacterium]|nr:helix-turn-helix domain-containing protein [Bacteroidales bacterium]
MEIGIKVKRIREFRNYSQEYMAEHSGISQVSYSRIESGQTKLDIQRMEQIASVLEVDPVMLLSFDESFVFNNCHQHQGGKIVNNYNGLAETERTTLLSRIQQLEKLVEELVQQKKCS